MTKNSRDTSYASRAGAKVSYPKLKSKDGAKKFENNNTEAEHEEGPSKQDIIDLINKSKVLDNHKQRSELFDMINKFLNNAEVDSLFK